MNALDLSIEVQKQMDSAKNPLTTDALDHGMQDALHQAILDQKFDVAHTYIDALEDINFLVSGEVENWELPLLHVVISQTLKHARFPRPQIEGPKNDGVLFRHYGKVLEHLLERGANVNKTDSYGNLAIMRAVLDSINLDLSITDYEFDEDVTYVFQLLTDHGANIRKRTKNRDSVLEMFRNHKVLSYF